MAMWEDYCPILDDDVVVFLDSEGNLKNVAWNFPGGGPCPMLDQRNRRTCERKVRATGTLVGVDGRIIDVLSDPKGQYCEFFDPKSMW